MIITHESPGAVLEVNSIWAPQIDRVTTKVGDSRRLAQLRRRNKCKFSRQTRPEKEAIAGRNCCSSTLLLFYLFLRRPVKLLLRKSGQLPIVLSCFCLLTCYLFVCLLDVLRSHPHWRLEPLLLRAKHQSARQKRAHLSPVALPFPFPTTTTSGSKGKQN